MKLYHATTKDAAQRAWNDGFNGGDAWNYLKDVVFFADRPLEGFGGWSECWIEIEIPDELAEKNDLYQEYEKGWDEGQYKAKCFVFKAKFVNQPEIINTMKIHEKNPKEEESEDGLY